MINNSSVIFMPRIQNRVSLSTAKAESVVSLCVVRWRSAAGEKLICGDGDRNDNPVIVHKDN